MINSEYMNNRDSAYIRGQNCIDFIAALTRLLQFIDGSYVVNYNKVILNDHYGYITDITLEEYFNMKSFNIDCIDNSRLNSRKLSYRIKFTEKVEELIEETNLLEIVNELYHIYTINKMLEMLDEKILHILNKVRKFIKGLCYNVLFSIAKVIAKVKLIF
jgi:hypothetical protein